jgi:hypothetical protein
MKYSLPLLLLIMAQLSTLVHAEVLEFDVASFTGSSSASFGVDTLIYYGNPVKVNSVSVRAVGTVDFLGLLSCEVPPGEPQDTMTWQMAWNGTVKKSADPQYDLWLGGSYTYYGEIGLIDETSDYSSNRGFSALSEGDAVVITFRFWAAEWIGYCNLVSPPIGTVISVTLLIDVNQIVPTEPTTWGRIKSLF